MEEARKSRLALYDVDKIGAAFDEAQKSAMKPLGAALLALKPKILAYLAEGYTIRDAVAVLQSAGVQGTERQIRYALGQIGITDEKRRDVRRELRENLVQASRGRGRDLEDLFADDAEPAISAAE